MKSSRNRWRVTCSRDAVPGLWVVGERLPADAFGPERWWAWGIFHTYEAAIIYATRRAIGITHGSASVYAAEIDAERVLARRGGAA